MGKLSAQQVLYFDSGGPSRCDRCVLYAADTSECVILGITVSGPDGVCRLFVPGRPTTSEKFPPQMLLDKNEAGYGADAGQGGYSCGNCSYGDGRKRCANPNLTGFDISNTGGCCVAWEEITLNERAAAVQPLLTRARQA